MLKELGQITDPSLRERLDRGLVSNLIKAKVNIGLGLKKSSKKTVKWTDQLAEELRKPVIKKFRKRRIYVKGIDQISAGDLVDMQAFSKYNNGVKYLLTVIDVFFEIWLDETSEK